LILVQKAIIVSSWVGGGAFIAAPWVIRFQNVWTRTHHTLFHLITHYA